MARLAGRNRVREGRGYFIRESIRKPGALRAQLEIPENSSIPRSFLMAIQRAEVGWIVKNPTGVGVDQIRATRLLKQRVNLALTLRQF